MEIRIKKSKDENIDSVKENIDKALIKRTKINEILESDQYYNKNSYNNSLKENKKFISQTNTLEISKDSKNIESNKISYILSSEKKDQNNLSLKLIKKEKKNNSRILNNHLLTHNFDIISPKYIINNKNIVNDIVFKRDNIKTQKTDNKNNHITKKRIDTHNKSSSNKYKNFDFFLKQKQICKTFGNFLQNESSNIKNIKEKILNYDNIRIVKIPESNDSTNFFYNNKNKSINQDIILK